MKAQETETIVHCEGKYNQHAYPKRRTVSGGAIHYRRATASELEPNIRRLRQKGHTHHTESSGNTSCANVREDVLPK